jgi:hypothetical protein
MRFSDVPLKLTAACTTTHRAAGDEAWENSRYSKGLRGGLLEGRCRVISSNFTSPSAVEVFGDASASYSLGLRKANFLFEDLKSRKRFASGPSVRWSLLFGSSDWLPLHWPAVDHVTCSYRASSSADRYCRCDMSPVSKHHGRETAAQNTLWWAVHTRSLLQDVRRSHGSTVAILEDNCTGNEIQAVDSKKWLEFNESAIYRRNSWFPECTHDFGRRAKRKETAGKTRN